MDGFLNLLKKQGVSSAAVVGFVRRRLPKGVRIGHMGTLDPMAEGVLPIGVGKATRLFDYLHEDKVYRAELRFGFETDTDDAMGKCIEVSDYMPGEEEINRILKTFQGTITQIPPAYSALKFNGRPLYELARKGIEVSPPAREVEIEAIDEVQRLDSDRWAFTVHCSRGTYIRSLCRDIGRAAGARAHMSALTRCRSGIFDLSSALLPDELPENPRDWPFIALDAPLQGMPRVDLEGPQIRFMVQNGRALSLPQTQKGIYRLYCDGDFSGVLEVEEGIGRFRVMLLGKEPAGNGACNEN